MPSPKDVIENIRKRRFGIGLATKNLSDDQKAAFQDKKNILKDAARLASDLYTEKPHFILELIQNAEDNEYEKSIKPEIKFIIKDDQLILENNERGFEEENVWAICGIGESTKRNKKLGYIGEKGVGFKSVFMVTNNPIIYSNGFQFEYKYDERDPISIIIPNWVNNIPDFVDIDKTTIVLPIKDNAKNGMFEFTKIDPRLLLFLRKLRTITIEDKIEKKSKKITRYDEKRKVKIVHPEGKANWMLVKKLFTVDKNVKEEKRKDIIETEIVLALPLKSDGSANTTTEQEVFVYLPVRAYGFKFIIQADFLVPPGRDDIHKDDSEKSWNKWIRDSIAFTFLQAVEDFKKDKHLKKTFYNYIPLVEEITDAFFTPIATQIQTALHGKECILTESGGWLKPGEVFRAEKDIRKLISNDDLKKFFHKEYISSDIKADESILDILEVPKFEFSHLIQCLQNAEWLKKQTDEWFVKLYVYLNSSELKPEQLQELKKLKIIRLERNGELASNLDEPIFFPLNKKSNYEFEKDLRILKRTIFEPKEKKKKKGVIDFLGKIDVRDALPYEIIEEHILPIYENIDESSNWKNKDEKVLLGHICYIKDNLEDYKKKADKQLNAHKDQLEKKEDPLKRLKDSLFILINKAADGVKYYDHPEKTYLPKAYGNENNLEALFEGIDDIQFVSQEYTKVINIKKYPRLTRKNKKSKINSKKKEGAEIREWRMFFVKLGVHTIPRVITEKEIRRHITNWGSEYKKEVTVYSSPDICSIIDIKNTEKNKKLVGILDQNWDYYKKFKEWADWYFYYNWNHQKSESDWFEKVKTVSWLPTTNSNDPFAMPIETFLDKPEIKAFLGDSVPYLAVEIKNQEFIKDIKINSEVTIEGVLNYLKSLAQHACTDKDAFINLYAFLNKKYDGNDSGSIIKASFSENQIIYAPCTTQSYFTSQKALWKDISEIFGDNRCYLEKHYPNLESFFVAKLGVRKKPLPKDYANLLLDLSQKDVINKKDEEIILKIYNEMNNHLNPKNSENLISNEDWWKDFVTKPIHWTNKEEFWKNDNDVFVNDDPVLYELFKDTSQAAFLKLPENHYPKIQYFIDAVRVFYLSKAVKKKLASNEIARLEQNLTEQIHKFIPYILRYLYQSEYDTYEKYKRDGTLYQLKNLTCYSVECLQVEYVLNQQSAFAQRRAILSGAKLYIQNDCLEDADYLAVEISKLFEDAKGLDIFLISLFDKKIDQKIEKLLKAKGIQELPAEEQEWLAQKQQLESKPLEPEIPEPPESKPLEPEPPKVAPSIPLRVITEQQIRNSELAKWVKESYGYHCQICLAGESPEFLSYKRSYSGRFLNRKALMEAHHIKSLGEHRGHDHPGNFLSLCYDHHKLIQRINVTINDLKLASNNIEKIPIKWPNGDQVDWFLISLGAKFKENGYAIKFVITPSHLEEFRKYINFLKM